MQYRQRLDEIEKRFEELTAQMADPKVINNSDLYRKTAKALSDLTEVVAKYREWKKAFADVEGARPMLAESDPELRAMAEEDIARLEPVMARLE